MSQRRIKKHPRKYLCSTRVRFLKAVKEANTFEDMYRIWNAWLDYNSDFEDDDGSAEDLMGEKFLSLVKTESQADTVFIHSKSKPKLCFRSLEKYLSFVKDAKSFDRIAISIFSTAFGEHLLDIFDEACLELIEEAFFKYSLEAESFRKAKDRKDLDDCLCNFRRTGSSCLDGRVSIAEILFFTRMGFRKTKV